MLRRMKFLSRLLVLGGVLLAPALLAADAFEGRLTLAVTSGKGPAQVINYAIKGSAMRIDMEIGKAESFQLFLLGGACYTVGTVFFAWDRLPYNHAVWHLFVLAGSGCHWLLIYRALTAAGQT